ncbi:MAG: hypothetical protein KJ721_01960, partial [Nanoarchaeota archaeon]|nr:hypothetical protein [Nanoarchaeota archaeon]
FPNLYDVFDYWLIKVGTKYFPEINAFSLKTLVPISRGGKKGQGISRSTEVSEALLKWALTNFPIMEEYKSLFRHIEFTGSGIARIDLRCKSSAAPLLFSLMRDSIISNNFIKWVKKNE